MNDDLGLPTLTVLVCFHRNYTFRWMNETERLAAVSKQQRSCTYLGVFTPNNLSTSGNETKLGDVDLNDRTLGHDTELL